MEYAKIKQSKVVPFNGNIHNYFTSEGYTKRSGAPTDYKVQLEGSNRWLRVYNFCNSNSGTLFVKTKHNDFVIVNSYDL